MQQRLANLLGRRCVGQAGLSLDQVERTCSLCACLIHRGIEQDIVLPVAAPMRPAHEQTRTVAQFFRAHGGQSRIVDQHLDRSMRRPPRAACMAANKNNVQFPAVVERDDRRSLI